MPAILMSILGFLISGLVWRILASIGFGLSTAVFITYVTDDYIDRSVNMMKTNISPDIAAYLNILHADDAISVSLGALIFIATYKSLKMIFVRS